jgi:hypothetical protein
MEILFIPYRNTMHSYAKIFHNNEYQYYEISVKCSKTPSLFKKNSSLTNLILKTIQRQMREWLVNNDLERMWKEAVIA